MDTEDHSAIEITGGSAANDSDDVEVDAMFERLRGRLGLQPSQREMLGRYEIRGKRIGAGGMGSVYRAYDAELEREIAIKVVSTRSLTKVHKLRERLRREAKLLAKLEHPHVVRVYDSGVDEGRVYVAMEFVDGVTLRQRQANQPFNEVLRLYIEAGQGLMAIHAQGIVHRDFKPDNVFIGDDGHARVGDFGLACVAGEGESGPADEPSEEPEPPSRMTRTGEVLGTVGYMAPEQLRGDQPDARSDQYSFCVSLWEALAGTRPFEGATREAQLAAMHRGQLQGRERIGWRLRGVLCTGLSQQPEGRYADMDTLVRVLEREHKRKIERPRRLLRFSAFALLLIMTVVASALGWRYYQAANPECELAELITSRSATMDWTALPSALVPRFEGHLETLAANARQACKTDNVARKQQIETLHRSLELTLEHLPKYKPEQLEDFVREFERALVARPSQPMTPDANAFIQEFVEPHEASGESVVVVERCDEGLDGIARSDADRTELLLRRGRAHSLNGKYELALADFKQARRFSVTASDEDRELRANLAAAKTTIMRLEQIDAGAELVAIAEDLIVAFGEPWHSPRRADLLELSASVAKRRGAVNEALVQQLAVVGRHALLGTTFDLVPALVNLASIHEQRGEVETAERAYRLALQLDPEDPEAAVNLGVLLVNQGRQFDEARILLTKVIAANNPDLHMLASVTLLQLELMSDGELDVVAKRRADLVRLLRSKQPATPTTLREAWGFVALALALAGDVGVEFEEALGQLPEPQTTQEQFDRVRLELSVAMVLPPELAGPIAEFRDRASARLQRLPPSEERSQLLLLAQPIPAHQ